MKKSLLALALFGAFASVAQAQSSVTIYGDVDLGIQHYSNTTTSSNTHTAKTVEKGGDNSRLGFKGTEDLGGGLKAVFQLEIRYDADTGNNENNTRPLFQGESRVGLQGDFGMVRLGRGLTPMEATSAAFEPWSWMPNRVGGFSSDVMVAGYTASPLDGTNSSKNRFSNGIFYNSPVFSGFQINAAMTTKEAGTCTNTSSATTCAYTGITAVGATSLKSTATTITASSEAIATPYSISATYINGPVGVMVAAERNALDTKYMSAGVYFLPIPTLKVMVDYSRQDQSSTIVEAYDKTTAWLVGANYTIGAGKILAGYGQKRPDGLTTTKQTSLGYEHNLSKRTFLYTDVMNKKAALSATKASSVNSIDVGIHHNF
jgi:predicted porin